MRSQAIREAFLNFFAQRGHRCLPGSSLLPDNDNSLLFTNAGMVQFKDYFLGSQKAPFERVCTSQRCLRAGGKHNDLDNVGYTARHHTLFEMLGNFSFGDYFKEEAINWAWQFLTADRPEGLGLNPRNLWVTVFGGGRLFGADQDPVPADREALNLWSKCLQDSGFSEIEAEQRITALGNHDNFWMMGETGPCGPCTEIFYNSDINAQQFTGNEAEFADQCIEIWNLVFMQYNRSEKGLALLPSPCVDTGMGLERIAAVVQGVASNYQTDQFEQLLAAIADSTAEGESGIDASGEYSASHRVIADHLRAIAYLLLDGVLPDNEGRGYVLRRIIRRAARHAWQLGLQRGCLSTLLAELAEIAGDSELSQHRQQLAEALKMEEDRFALTLEQGMQILEHSLAEHDKDTAVRGELVFKLYDTYGFPADLTQDILRERGLDADMDEFQQLMAQQRQRARRGNAFKAHSTTAVTPEQSTCFDGYEKLETAAAITGLWQQRSNLEQVRAGDRAQIILDNTTFYAEGGGQVGDRGVLLRDDKIVFEVTNTTRSGEAILHDGVAVGDLALGERIVTRVDHCERQATARNHSATHLLHAALREQLGPHIRQRGSLVDAQRLRFDFSHPEPLSHSHCQSLEQLVNQKIIANTPVQVSQMSMEAARQQGAVALFGERYGETVRVLGMGVPSASSAQPHFSLELCGGTHVGRTGDIGLFRIVKEAGISSGVRRIEAVTGEAALTVAQHHDSQLKKLSEQLNCGEAEIVEKVHRLIEQQGENRRELQNLRRRSILGSADKPGAESAVTVGSTKILTRLMQEVDTATLRSTVDDYRKALGSAVVLLATQKNERLLLVSGVTDDLSTKISAAELMQEFAARLGGKGGGKREFAQGSGSRAELWDEVSQAVPDWVRERLD